MDATSNRSNVEVVMELYGITSQYKLADILGVTQGAVHKWIRGTSKPPAELADWAGVSYDWLRGKSPVMWNHEMLSLRRSLRANFAEDDSYRASSPSSRFRAVVTWVFDQETFVCSETLSMYLRIDERTLWSIMDGTTSVEWATILRLADYLDIPREWFEDGSPKHLMVDRYERVVQRLIEEKIAPDDAMKIIDALVATRSRSI